MVGEVAEISSETAWDFLQFRHYAGRRPQISIAFGWFINTKLVAVCTFGKPASNFVCESICGKEYKDSVYELNRLCRVDDLKEQLSQFVSYCLRELKKKDWIIVSYSDEGMHHNGYIYQACNFIYTGRTPERSDKCSLDGAHPRHHTHDETKFRVVRTPKHRYIYFATSNKKLKKKWGKALNFPIEPYPKGQNENYVLGEYQKQVAIDTETGEKFTVESTSNNKTELW